MKLATKAATKAEQIAVELPKPPHHLSTQMKKFFNGIVAEVPTLRPEEILLLVQACEANGKAVPRR
ncbi:MAG: hypothetical protein ACM3TN_27330 [Alphaproteobacteria bacterium]